MNRIKKGDTVRVISGSKRGQEGIVLQMILDKDNPNNNWAIVEGVNMIKKHQKKDQTHEESGIITKEAPVRLCKLALVDAKAKKISKVSFVTIDGKKTRVTKKSKTQLDATKK